MLSGLFARNSAAKDACSVVAGDQAAPADRTRTSGDALLQALQTRRYGLIVRGRQQWLQHPHFQSVFEEAVKAVDELFALVPEGMVSLSLSTFDQPGQPETEVPTAAFLLARHAVTNADYQLFVDAGGYQQLEIWPRDIWPHLINMKDQTGQPGPRYWRDGQHDRRLARHPVVGVCYYEAAAYAAWAGYRLPTDAEWQMAASWRVRGAADAQRRYPWGDGFEVGRCNLWASGHGGTLPVEACPEGAAPNGVLQLVGNVWEWTDGEFRCTDRDGRLVVGATLLKTIRGGAYDTYFPWQATSTFRTAADSMARSPNIGFRCALDLLTN